MVLIPGEIAFLAQKKDDVDLIFEFGMFNTRVDNRFQWSLASWGSSQ